MKFRVFIDLSPVACSIVIRICRTDRLPVKSMNFEGDVSIEKCRCQLCQRSWQCSTVRAHAFESELTNQELRN